MRSARHASEEKPQNGRDRDRGDGQSMGGRRKLLGRGPTMASDPQLAMLLASSTRRFDSLGSCRTVQTSPRIPLRPFGVSGAAAPMLFEGFAGQPLDSPVVDVSGDGDWSQPQGLAADRSISTVVDCRRGPSCRSW